MCSIFFHEKSCHYSQMADTCAVRIDFIDSRVKGPDNSGKCATDKIDFM